MHATIFRRRARCCITAGKRKLVESSAERSVAGTPCTVVPSVGLPWGRAALTGSDEGASPRARTRRTPEVPQSPHPRASGRRRAADAPQARGEPGRGGWPGRGRHPAPHPRAAAADDDQRRRHPGHRHLRGALLRRRPRPARPSPSPSSSPASRHSSRRSRTRKWPARCPSPDGPTRTRTRRWANAWPGSAAGASCWSTGSPSRPSRWAGANTSTSCSTARWA